MRCRDVSQTPRRQVGGEGVCLTSWVRDWPCPLEGDPPRGREGSSSHSLSVFPHPPSKELVSCHHRIYKPVIGIETFSNTIFFLLVLSTRDLWFTVNSLYTDNVWSAGRKASDVSAVGEATTGVARRLDFSPMTSGSSAADADKTTPGVSICTSVTHCSILSPISTSMLLLLEQILQK